MRSPGTFLCALVLLAAILPGASASAEADGPAAPPYQESLKGVQAPGVRLAGVFGPPSCTPIRAKGVASVSHPSTGICCITPKPITGIIVGKIVPTVTVDWGLSSGGSDLLAFYNGFNSACPAGTIEVRTYDLSGNLVDRVGFTVTVP